MTRRGTVLFVAALLLIVTPTWLLVWLRLHSEDRLVELSPAPITVVVSAGEVVVDGLRGVSLSLVWGEAPEVLAPSWAGMVTRVGVAVGEDVVTGDVLVAVDGVSRIAVATEVPFWRSLTRSDTGADVAALQELLQSLGFYDGEVDGRYGPAVASAVNRFAEGLGVFRPQGVFDPGWVVWLPEEPFVVDGIEAKVGSGAPDSGEVLLAGPMPISEVVVSDGEGRRPSLEGEWLLNVGGVDYEMADGILSPNSLNRLSAVLDPATQEVFGQVRRANPVSMVEIPATAVVSNQAGSLCVWTPAGEGFHPEPVVLEGGRIARVFVSAGLDPGDELLANPGEVLGDPTCP